MSNPIEVMAKAFFESRMNDWRDESGARLTWELAADSGCHQEHIAAMRAALLALSDCHLPGDGRDEDREFLFHFRAMLKKLAENSA